MIVYGDGNSTVEQLVESHPRARFYRSKLKKRHQKNRDTIIPDQEQYILVQFGAHHMGSTFVDISDQCTAKLEHTIAQMASQIEGFHYGRFDLKADSTQGIEEGKFSVIELNLTLAEPLQMYDPSWWYPRRIYELLRHRHYVYRISIYNHEKNNGYMSMATLWKLYRNYART